MRSLSILPIAALLLLFFAPTVSGQTKDSSGTPEPGELKPPSAIEGKSIEVWIKEIAHSDPSVRVRAIQMVPLFLKDSAKAVPALLLRAGQDKDVSVRANAVLSLDVVNVDEEQVDAVVQALGDRLGRAESQAVVRLYAASVLGRFGKHSQAALAQLIEGTIDPRSWEIRRAAVRSLGSAIEGMKAKDFDTTLNVLLVRLQSPPATMRRLDLTKFEHCSQVRLAATVTLSAMAKKGTPQQSTKIVEAFKRRLTDPNPTVAIWAHVGVMKIEGVSADYLDFLAKFLKHKELVARTNVLQAYASLGKGALPKVGDLVKLLDDEEPIVVGMAAWALGQILHVSKSRALVEMMILGMAGEPLGQKGVDVKLINAVVARLQKLSDDKKGDASARHAALLAIKRIKLENLLDDKEREAVQGLWDKYLERFKPGGAGGVLNKLGGKDLDQWIKEITNKDPSIRENAVRTVPYFEVDARDAVPNLIFVLKHDSDVSMRVNVARVLGTIKARGRDVENVVDVLKLRLTGDSQAIVRYQIAHALGSFKGDAEDAIRGLVYATRDIASWEIRNAAIESLRNIVREVKGPPDERVVRAFMTALTDASATVRLTAVGALGSLEFGKDSKIAPSVIRAVLQMKQKELNLKVAIWAHLSYMALTDVSDKQLDSLATYLKAKRVEVRATAAQALGVMAEHAQKKIPELIEALQDKEPQVQLMSAWALGEIGKKISPGKEAIDLLTKIAKDEKAHKELREAAEAALENITGKKKPAELKR